MPHLQKAEDAIISFGQGCEGEPLVQWRLLESIILKLREDRSWDDQPQHKWKFSKTGEEAL